MYRFGVIFFLSSLYLWDKTIKNFYVPLQIRERIINKILNH